MQTISRERCVLHEDREAVARCPECRRFFCRECVTEHQGRVVCSQCLGEMVRAGKTPGPASSRLGAVAQGLKKGTLATLQLLLGIVLAWFFFYYLGQAMISIPSSFHEGTLWESVDEDPQ